MILYALRCSGGGHEFESWFASGAAYDRMAAAGLLECPACGDTAVSKALMAPAVAKAPGVKGRPEAPSPAPIPAPAPTAGPASAPPSLPLPALPPGALPPGGLPPGALPPGALPPGAVRSAAGPMPAQLVALLQRMRAEVEKTCDHVGPRFAEEARRIHYGEAEARGIYGEASDAEADALREEGIDVARLPWVPRPD